MLGMGWDKCKMLGVGDEMLRMEGTGMTRWGREMRDDRKERWS